MCVGNQLWPVSLEGCQSVHTFISLSSTVLSLSFSRTFNPADYAEPAQTEENYGGGSTWNNTGSVELEEGASKLIYKVRLPSNERS